jgi:hypothetical protein
MMTVRMIERLWAARNYQRLFHELIASRPEASFPLEAELARLPASGAALALIRLDELSQSQTRITPELVRALLSAQDADGGWTDPMATALCLRALLLSEGHGLAIQRALTYLANMQKTEGIWPKLPFRRMPADSFASAFILFHLGDKRDFRAAVRFPDAVNWFHYHQHTLDVETRQLWQLTSLRCRVHSTAPQPDEIFILK